MTARWSGDWARPAEPSSPDVEVLIPAYERPAELAVTLAGLAGQRSPNFSVILSDQTEDHPIWREASVAAMVRVLRAQGRDVRLERHLPRHGIAEQREFLLERATAPYVLLLDSDVWLEPGQLQRLYEALVESDCGFVGAAIQGLSYLGDDRPDERSAFEPWNGPVEPETIRRGDPAFERWRLHNAANLVHVAAEHDVPEGQWMLYKVAWIAGCVLYRREALVEAGGFGFWTELPDDHSGEDVLAEWRVMERWGGAGVLPSGAVHLEAETPSPNAASTPSTPSSAPPPTDRTHPPQGSASGAKWGRSTANRPHFAPLGTHFAPLGGGRRPSGEPPHRRDDRRVNAGSAWPGLAAADGSGCRRSRSPREGGVR